MDANGSLSDLDEPGKLLTSIDVLSLGPGAPSSQYYPFDHISVEVPTVQESNPTQAIWDSSSFTTNKYDIKAGKSGYGI